MPKVKKCAICKTPMEHLRNALQKYCSYECAQKGAKKLAKKRTRIKNRSNGIKVLDDKWSRLVKERDGNKCVYCGKTDYLNSHHIFSRSNKSTRWYLPNGITLCVGHHTFSTKFSAHKTPMEFAEWIKGKNGADWYEDLLRKASQVDKNENEYWLNYLKEQEDVIYNN